MAPPPPDWIGALHTGAEEANDKVLHTLIRQIDEEHAVLAHTLSSWVNNFQFDEILTLTRTIEEA